MTDPWWNIRCYLPRTEVRRLFTLWREVGAAKDRLAQPLTLAANGIVSGGSMLNPDPPAGD